LFASKSLTIKSMNDLAGKSIAVTRGALEDQELTKVAPSSADIKRFEDNNATVSAFVSGQTQLVATGASVAGNMMQRNPSLSAEFKFVLKDSPNFIGLNKGEDKLRLKVNEIIAAAKAEREAVAQSVGQETAKVASLGEAAQPKPAEVTPAMLRLIKSELSRVGCDPGSTVDGQWTDKSRAALEQFGKRTKVAVHAATPDAGTLDLLTRQKERVCPLICPEGETEKDGKCAKKPAAATAPPAKTSANRPDPVDYSRGIWPTDTIGNKNVVSKSTQYGTLTCTGGPLPGVRLCHWD
jgi:hypothetical protein